MGDETVRKLLFAHSVETCQPDRRFGIKRKLTGTIAGIHRCDEDLSSQMSVSTLYKQCKRARLGFCKGHNRVDDCDYCVQFDAVYGREMERIIAAGRARAEALLPGYWNDFDAWVLEQPPMQMSSFKRHCSPRYIERFCNLHP